MAASSIHSLDTARFETTHPRPKTIGAVHMRSADRTRVFAIRIDGVRSDAGWSYDDIGAVLDMTRQDAQRLCEHGKATADQLALVLARAPRRAA